MAVSIVLPPPSAISPSVLAPVAAATQGATESVVGSGTTPLNAGAPPHLRRRSATSGSDAKIWIDDEQWPLDAQHRGHLRQVLDRPAGESKHPGERDARGHANGPRVQPPTIGERQVDAADGGWINSWRSQAKRRWLAAFVPAGWRRLTRRWRTRAFTTKLSALQGASTTAARSGVNGRWWSDERAAVLPEAT